MVYCVIDGINFLIKSTSSIIEACKYLGINIPKFCYHENLTIAGNCRMCLIEIHKTLKPVAACAMPVINNIVVFTNTPSIKKARENVLETLLLHHPLDCPICDQGGECDLQDETKTFGGDRHRFFLIKRSVEDKSCGLIIKTIMSRCIHCTRCVRFSSEIAGSNFFGTINRGVNTEISSYTTRTFNSLLSGNVIELCPVGALTSNNYAFKTRSWELQSIETLDLTDGSSTPCYFNYKESEVIRILPKNNFDILGDNWISDRLRFSFDALNNSRLHSIFRVFLPNKFKKTNWKFIFYSLKKHIFKESSKITVLINNEIDLDSLILLKKICYQSKNIVSFCSVENINTTQNFYISWLSNKIVDIAQTKVSFLLFTNLYIENLLLNTQLKVYYKKKNYKNYNFGTQSINNLSIRFNNISLFNLFTLFTGKNIHMSKTLVGFNNPLVLLGESLTTKLNISQQLIFLLKEVISTVTILNINLKSNTESLRLTNTRFKNTKCFDVIKGLVSINLSDNISTRRDLNKNKTKFWLNPHGSLIALKNKYIIPILHPIEQQGVFINLEQRPQRTTSLVTNTSNAKSIYFFLKLLLNNIKQINKVYGFGRQKEKYKYLFIINYLVENFYTIKRVGLSYFFYKSLISYTRNSFIFYENPVSYYYTDFFLINNYCKNSLNMNLFSINYRKVNKTFHF